MTERNYPSQEDAEFLAALTNALNGVYPQSAGAESRKAFDEIDRIRQGLWDRTFGDESPWVLCRAGSKIKKEGKLVVKWDQAKWDRAQSKGI